MNIGNLLKMARRERDEMVAEKVMGFANPPYPKCSTDPAADYEVLDHVRDTWDHHKRERFASTLFELWDYRPGFDRMNYEPGDYALAALAVVTAGTEVTS